MNKEEQVGAYLLDLSDPNEDRDPANPWHEPETPTCRYCGHRLHAHELVVVFSKKDADAMWYVCDACVGKMIDHGPLA
jgi:hypothetical protein